MSKKAKNFVVVYGEGYRFYKRGDGRLQANINGKSVYGHTELELKTNIKAYLDGEEEEKLSKELFSKDIVRWLKLTYYKNVKSTTYDRYEQVVRYQIVPEAEKLRHKKVTDIDMDDIKTIFFNIGEAYSSSTAKKVRNLLKNYFEDMLRAGQIKIDPTDFKDRKTFEDDGEILDDEEDNEDAGEEGDKENYEDGKKVVYLTNAEIEKVKNVIYNGYDLTGKTPSVVKKDGKTYACNDQHKKTTHNKIPQGEFFIFMMNTGLRGGEAVALKYSDIDFEKNTMTVMRNFKAPKERDADGNSTGKRVKQIGKPKTKGSEATVRIPSKAIDILKKMLKEEPEGYTGYIVHGTRNPKEGSSFKAVKHLSTHALYKRWQTVCKYAGIEPKGLHCLRHTTASQMFASTNGNAKAVQTLLRHTDITTTLRVYVDLIKEYQESIFQDFEV